VETDAARATAYFGNFDPNDIAGPEDLDQIGEAAKPAGYIGVIYADGNSFGAYIGQARTPAHYSTRANRVYQALEEAVYATLERHIKPQSIRNKKIYPFEILSIGGDDVFLIVPGQKALAVALDLIESVERRFGLPNASAAPHYGIHRYTPFATGLEPEVYRPEYERTLTISAGVLIANHHTPVFFLRRLAEELLEEAKRMAKKKPERGSTIDFLSLKSTPMLASGIAEFRQMVQTLRRDREELRLTGRPYTLPEMRGLLKAVQVLKEAQFPRSQLYALHAMLFQGRLPSTINYLYFITRLKERYFKTIQQYVSLPWSGQDWKDHVPPPWRHVEQKIYEIYPFVEVKDE
jgi:CRISPR-associated protein Cmr2